MKRKLKYNWRCYEHFNQKDGKLFSSTRMLLYSLWKDYNYCEKHNEYWNKCMKDSVPDV